MLQSKHYMVQSYSIRQFLWIMPLSDNRQRISQKDEQLVEEVEVEVVLEVAVLVEVEAEAGIEKVEVEHQMRRWSERKNSPWKQYAVSNDR